MNGDGQKTVNTYDPAQLKKNNKSPKGVKGLVVFLIVVAVIVAAGFLFSFTDFSIFGSSDEDYDFGHDYVGVIKLEGTIGDTDESYNQEWILERINQMKDDEKNKGIIISMNTPGGNVYETDEVYLAVKDYKTKTGRPVYTYMESMAASGGYYIASACDKIYANRNCWTGSIGVTVGSVYDISGLLKKAGIKTVTITSGRNKAMGSMENPLTKEQKEIYQSLVDEAYDQFVDIVAKGRKMPLKKVKKLADGRVYTAKQAKKNGLIDGIYNFDEAAKIMFSENSISDCQLETMEYEPEMSLSSVLGLINKLKKSDAEGEYDDLMALAEKNSNFNISYRAQIRK